MEPDHGGGDQAAEAEDGGYGGLPLDELGIEGGEPEVRLDDEGDADRPAGDPVPIFGDVVLDCHPPYVALRWRERNHRLRQGPPP